MKKILLILFLVLNAYSSSISFKNKFLEADQAFKTNYIENEDSIVFSIKLAKDIYLYDDKIKVQIIKPKKVNITKDIKKVKPKEHDGFMVHFNNLDINIPHSVLSSNVGKNKDIELLVKYQGCSTAGLCYAPMEEKFTINTTIKSSKNTTNTDIKEENLSEIDSIANTLKTGSIWIVLVTFFGFGLLLSLTPCVFPMIPILSSIIVKAGHSENLTMFKGFVLSLVYVLSMSFAYTIAGIIAGLFGANLQVALQNPFVLVIFSLIFVALAFSMFGYFKLELPQSLQNKINKTTDGKEKQGILGIAIMGFLSALIVGPCVAPPLAGALVYIGQTGDALLGGLALFTLSMGMGMPLLLIGIGAGRFMPKPGIWMDSISKIFGLVMLGIAIFMLERVLDESIIMLLYSALFLGSALYLRIYKHILAQVFISMLFLFGTSLFVGFLSGSTNPLKPFEKFTNGKNKEEIKKLNVIKIKNLQELKEQIKISKKPIMLDFTASWCTACKEFEEITFKDDKVISKLQNFTLLKIDVSKNTDEDKIIQKNFGIVGPPAIVFWNKEKKYLENKKVVGYKNPKEFLAILNNINL